MSSNTSCYLSIFFGEFYFVEGSIYSYQLQPGLILEIETSRYQRIKVHLFELHRNNE